MKEIHPIFDRIITRDQKEKLLKQRAKVLWFTGLSGSGKSTIASGVESILHQQGYLTQILDGDNIRHGINSNLGFSIEDREENIRRIAEVAKLYLNTGIISLCSFISPTVAIRKKACDFIGTEDIMEIFIDTPIEVCEARDVKGLYRKARAGEINDFTGIDSPYEKPTDPYLRVLTQGQAVEDSIEQVLLAIIPQLKRKQ